MLPNVGLLLYTEMTHMAQAVDILCYVRTIIDENVGIHSYILLLTSELDALLAFSWQYLATRRDYIEKPATLDMPTAFGHVLE